MKTQTAKVTATGHFYRDKREEVYFIAELDLPRVGEVKMRFHADRYVARSFNGERDYTGHNVWTKWRVLRDSSTPGSGVGPKTIDAVRAAVEPLVMAWLDGPEYAPSRQRELARFIAREASERYGLACGKEALAKHRDELTEDAADRLTRGIAAIELGQKLLSEACE